MPSKRHSLPAFLAGRVDPLVYERWLARKADAHLKRDRKRGYEGVSGSLYRKEIHKAVLASEGRDYYTGEELDWSLLSKYINAESIAGKHAYKAGFALLPTIDHIESARMNSGFRICGWRTNDAKHDLTHHEFIQLCKLVLQKAGFNVTSEAQPFVAPENPQPLRRLRPSGELKRYALCITLKIHKIGKATSPEIWCASTSDALLLPLE